MHTFPTTFFTALEEAGGGGSIISSIQPFSITISDTSTSNTATVTSVDTSRSVIAGAGISTDYEGVDHENYCVRLSLTNGTTVTAERNGSSDAVTIYGTLIEFAASAIDSVQYGTVSIGSTATSATDTITSVTTSRSVIMMLGHEVIGGAQSHPKYCFPTIELTNATTVTAERDDFDSARSLEVGYVVVEFNSSVISSIQQRSVTTTTSDFTIDDTVSSVDTSRSVILPNGSLGLTHVEERWWFRLELTSSTNVRATRLLASTNERTFKYTLLEFASGIVDTLQRGSISLSGTTATNTATITSVDTSKSVCFFTGQATDGDNPAERVGYVTLTNATTVTAAKDNGESGDNVDVGYEIVEFI